MGSDSDWAAVSCGGGHTLALKRDGSLWAWGDNDYGQLGLGDTTSSNSPDPGRQRQRLGGRRLRRHYTLALKSDGSLWAWGDNQTASSAWATPRTGTPRPRSAAASDWAAVSCGD